MWDFAKTRVICLFVVDSLYLRGNAFPHLPSERVLEMRRFHFGCRLNRVFSRQSNTPQDSWEVHGICSFCLINFTPRLLITPESISFRRKPIRPAKAVYKRQSSVREHRACQLLRGIGWAHIWTSHGRLCHSLICYGLATSISTLRSFWLRSCCAWSAWGLNP